MSGLYLRLIAFDTMCVFYALLCQHYLLQNEGHVNILVAQPEIPTTLPGRKHSLRSYYYVNMAVRAATEKVTAYPFYT